MDGLQKISHTLACPRCRTPLSSDAASLACGSCGIAYRVINGVLDMRGPSDREKAEAVDWSQHWSQEHQGRLAQKFFSWYRRAVFARTVRYFLARFFPSSGVFVEAGSGTAETSTRVDKHGGKRMLVAVDIVLPVLFQCHPVMDARICADNFRLPFRDSSIDGLWNLGVMEHFTHDKIDEMLREFRRALKPGGRVILFWPAENSIPQKILKVAEKMINLKKREHRFRFHPDEISQLASSRQGREVLARNGFAPLYVDFGLRSLMAFKSVVGEKKQTV